MDRNSKVLILYTTYGDGHVQVMRALQKQLQQQGANRIVTKDLMAEAHPVLNTVTRFAYLKSMVYYPKLYGWSYDLTNQVGIWKWVHMLCIRRLHQIIKEEQPDAVIHTFPMLAMSQLRERSGIYIPTFTIVTDFVYHRQWVHPETDLYFVADEDLKEKMIKKGVRADQIKVSGIPIRDSFQKPINSMEVYARYGLRSDKRHVLVMAGASGVFLDLKKIIRTLLTIGETEILLVCGRNHSAKKRMELYFSGHPSLRVFGFVEQVQELMGVAACIVTKAGGVTLSESLSMGLPAIVYRPLPGQERDNAKFLAKKGAVKIVRSIADLKSYVLQALENQQNGIQNERYLSSYRSNAAETVVEEVFKVVELRASHKRVALEFRATEGSHSHDF